MEYRYEADTDDLYIRLRSEAVARTLEVTNGCLVDVDYKGQAVGIEVLSASRGWPVQDVVRQFHLYDVHPLLNELEQHIRPVSAVPAAQPNLAFSGSLQGTGS